MKTDAHWKNIGQKKHHGIALPLSALGKFYDLLPLIDWCAKVGFDVIQLLPINDTGDDPSPYNAISSCALNPIYSTPEPVEFVIQDKWLEDYAKFKGDPAAIQEQELCFQQMKKVRDYATKKGVMLMGDIPILISAHSADVAFEPQLFDLTLEAGAPPDMYNLKGQHWGFPLFNWDEMRKENFAWWKRRLRVAENFFHLYRIDHVVGLFRIWGIPHGAAPTEGHFEPTDPALWPRQGREVLEMMLASSEMLPIAEDLGADPKYETLGEVVRPMMKELGICGTKVLRWERRWHGDMSFIPYSEYDPYSLTTVSTHDSEPLSVWWKNRPDEAALFAQFKGWEYSPELSRDQKFEILKDSHHTPSYFHVNLLQEYLTLFPELSWPNPEDERINVPGTISPKNWSYRFKPTVEEIVGHKGLAEVIQKLVKG